MNPERLRVTASAVSKIESRLDRDAFDDALSLKASERRRAIIAEVAEAILLARRDDGLHLYDESGDPTTPAMR